MEVLNLKSINEWPESIDEEAWTNEQDQRKVLMDKIMSQVVDKFVNVQFNSPHKTTNDHVLGYALKYRVTLYGIC